MTIETEQTEPEFGIPDEENPEWTAAEFENAMSYSNLPAELMSIIEADKKARAVVGIQEETILVRLPPDALNALRATGSGWQARAYHPLQLQFVQIMRKSPPTPAGLA